MSDLQPLNYFRSDQIKPKGRGLLLGMGIAVLVIACSSLLMTFRIFGFPHWIQTPSIPYLIRWMFTAFLCCLEIALGVAAVKRSTWVQTLAILCASLALLADSEWVLRLIAGIISGQSSAAISYSVALLVHLGYWLIVYFYFTRRSLIPLLLPPRWSPPLPRNSLIWICFTMIVTVQSLIEGPLIFPRSMGNSEAEMQMGILLQVAILICSVLHLAGSKRAVEALILAASLLVLLTGYSQLHHLHLSDVLDSYRYARYPNFIGGRILIFATVACSGVIVHRPRPTSTAEPTPGSASG